jgi:4-amino-4-deoxy-L-arabinose transferase-like glycosyltransferase
VRSRLVVWLALGLIVLGAAAIRARLLDIPLDRDEGEYAYFGQLLLQGVPPYSAAYNLKAPGIYIAYSLILALFGQTTTGIHVGLIVVTSLATVLMFVLARDLAGPTAGLVAAALYATQALNPRMLGFAGYAEHFVLLFVIAGSIVLRPLAPGRPPLGLVAGGCLFGLAFLMKQSAAAFVLGAVLFVFLSSADDRAVDDGAATGEREIAPWPPRLRAVVLFLGGAVAPFVLVCLWLLLAGTLGTFLFWAFAYGSTYSASLSASVGNLGGRFVAIAPSSSVTLTLIVIGIVALLRDRLRARKTFVLLLAAASGVGFAAGLHFRPQYGLLLIAPLAIMAAIGVDALARLMPPQPTGLRMAVPVVLVIAALAQPLYASRDVLFQLGPDQISRLVYGRNPFPESVPVARYIREHTRPGDRVAVVGSEPQIYFYAGRRSATGYIYTYPLMELQPYASEMQQAMIREIESGDPRYVVFVRAVGSWLVRENSDKTIFGWFEQYQQNLKRVGVVDIPPQHETVYRWGDDAATYAPRSDVWLMIFERGRKP